MQKSSQFIRGNFSPINIIIGYIGDALPLDTVKTFSATVLYDPKSPPYMYLNEGL